MLIRGPPGVGKTTICERLADVLHVERFEVEQLLDSLEINELIDRETPSERFMAAYDSAMPAARHSRRIGRASRCPLRAFAPVPNPRLARGRDRR